jgi:hypothetical protein
MKVVLFCGVFGMSPAVATFSLDIIFAAPPEWTDHA